MSGPRDATTNGDGSRFYTWPATGEKFTSVTTIIGSGIPKPALMYWAAKVCAEYAADNLATLNTLDRAAIVDLVKSAHRRTRDQAADKGTDIHANVERYFLTGEVGAGLDSFMEFLDHFAPEIELAEATVYSRTHGYAGTLDALMWFGDDLVLVDVKTGKGVYPEAALQLSAYAHADFIGLSNGAEVPMPEIDRAAVLHLRPRGYKLIPVDVGEQSFKAFLGAKATGDWMRDVAPDVIGPPMPLPLKAVS